MFPPSRSQRFYPSDTRQAPITPLFPYTTLFRSRHSPAARRSCSSLRLPRSSVTFGSRQADRKSTRLNSSHITTSYAVFCLKKKRFGEGSEVASLDTKLYDTTIVTEVCVRNAVVK